MTQAKEEEEGEEEDGSPCLSADQHFGVTLLLLIDIVQRCCRGGRFTLIVGKLFFKKKVTHLSNA